MRFNRILLFVVVFSLLGAFAHECSKAKAAESERAEAKSEENFIDSLTFLGDSITAHMQQRSPLRAEQIWATQS